MRKYENTHACSGYFCTGSGGIAPFIPNYKINNKKESKQCFDRKKHNAIRDVSHIINNINKYN
jgi:hypothetical protein